MIKPKLCTDCGKSLHKNAQYRKANASIRCRPCYWKTLRKPRALCVDCGKPLPRRSAKRCMACNGIYQRLPLLRCVDCGKELNVNSRYMHTQRCHACEGKRIIGPNHPNWNNGSTPARKQTQNSEAYKFWRKTIFELDDYTCSFCGERGGKLHAHHILPFAKFPEYRTEIHNGATLCVPCHTGFHAELRAAGGSK